MIALKHIDFCVSVAGDRLAIITHSLEQFGLGKFRDRHFTVSVKCTS